MEYEDLLVEKKESIATITLNVPEKLNALTGKMSRNIKLAADDIDLEHLGCDQLGQDGACVGTLPPKHLRRQEPRGRPEVPVVVCKKPGRYEQPPRGVAQIRGHLVLEDLGLDGSDSPHVRPRIPRATGRDF